MLEVVASFINTLEEKEIKYRHTAPEKDGDREIIRVGYKGDHGNDLDFVFIFDDNNRSVNIKVWSICKVSEEKLVDMYVTLNELNYEYRWIKLYLDSDNEVTLSGDAVLSEMSAGDECFELLVRYLGILDDIFPRLMKVIWA